MAVPHLDLSPSGASPATGATRRSDPSSALRVCADPNNLPFSNDREEGFENALAELVARELGRRVEYTWWPQRRGFVRTTLRAGICDVIIGVPDDFEMALTTRPYYRSTYVAVSRRADGPPIRTLDDARLKRLRIGIHVIGDDYANVPPGDALAARGIVRNVRGYSIYGDYGRPHPPADLIAAVGAGEVDVAIAWGPLAGYFAAQPPEGRDAAGRAPPLVVTRLAGVREVPLQFSIAMGVRRGDRKLRDAIDEVLVRRGSEVRALLDRFHVPVLPPAPEPPATVSR
jgi:quinoprotein dehydrogenase-associated probable ABC transporter substrate-binding protein